MKKGSILVSVLAVLFLTACYEDKGDYNPIDYNKIFSQKTLKGSKQTVTLGDTIKIFPSFEWKFPDRDTTENAFEFVWKMNYDGDTLSTSRDLIYPTTECMTNTSMYLYVKEKATNITYSFSWQVNVNSPYLSGWFMVANQNGRGAFHYSRRDSRKNEEGKTEYYWTDFKDVYNELYPSDPLNSLVSGYVYTVANYDDEILLFDKDGRAIVYDCLSFKRILDTEEEFSGGYPDGFVPKQLIRGGVCDFLLGHNGDVYYRYNSAMSSLYHDVYFMSEPSYIEGGLKVSRLFNLNYGGLDAILGHDTLNNRLVGWYSSWNSGNYSLGVPIDFQNSLAVGEVADPFNLKDYELLYFTNHSKTASFVMLSKRSDKYYFSEFSMSGGFDEYKVSSYSQVEFVGSSYINDKSVYHRLKSADYFYFSSNEKLYCVDGATDKVIYYGSFEGNITHLAEGPKSLLLGVATDRGNFYVIDPMTAEVLGNPDPLQVGLVHSMSGLGDIVDLYWKWGGYYPMIFDSYN